MCDKQGELSVNNFMADPGRHSGSRDFMLDQSVCTAVKCICNSGGYCFVPSRIEIGEDGRCTGFKLRQKSAPNIRGL